MSRHGAAVLGIILCACFALTLAVDRVASYEDFIADRMGRIVYASLVMEITQSGGISGYPLLPEGWMSQYSAYTVAALSSAQRRLGISGGVAEIGVHHGLFFIALAHTAIRGERLFACDVFEQQHLNVDSSGRGDRELFEDSLRRFGVEPQQVSIHEGDSRLLTPTMLFGGSANGSVGRGRGRGRGRGVAPFRLLSLDGGHGTQTVISDLRLAEATLVDGGIVILDDFTNDNWMGVREGFFQFALLDQLGAPRTSPSRLAPFVLLANKLFLTTPSHHAALLQAILEDGALREIGLHLLPSHDSGHPGGSTHLTGWPVAVVDDRWKTVKAHSLLICWDRLLSEGETYEQSPYSRLPEQMDME